MLSKQFTSMAESSEAKSPAGARSVSARLASAPRDLDAFLSHVQRCLSTPTGIDTILQFVCFASSLGSSLVGSASRHALDRLDSDLVAVAVSSSPPRAAVLVSGSSASSRRAVGSAAAAASGLVFAQRLKALSGLLSEARMMLRLWGLLRMYFWARRLVLQLVSRRSASASPEQKKGTSAETALSWAQLVLCILFQGLENITFLSSKGVLSWSPAAQVRARRWSSRFWGLYLVSSLFALSSACLRSLLEEAKR